MARSNAQPAPVAARNASRSPDATERRRRKHVSVMFGSGVVLVLAALVLGVPGLVSGPGWLAWFVVLVVPGVLLVWAAATDSGGRRPSSA
ncbi:MAG: hypothetical protein ACFCVE_03910 [Phycisphaerae bacterium]